ncbi:hypothetical protein GC088_03755 [Arthrobacter sp. JZ12]|uniref:hypothetical protein n=1 Tax=Arthrobacter sp. JZ12 TaxID=2654190 RepID=UPI002B4879BB|nr:hypothetical protein [Arthrobacter sp. JZ12]WRH24292.1 hypothetical protein GC088_03755 [Arthrobacter sp. JZ12]
MARIKADKSTHTARNKSTRFKRVSAWLIAAVAAVSVSSLALGWLQLQSVQRAVGLQLPDTMIGGYSADHVQAVRDELDAPVIERYQSVHYFWDLVFPVAFAALIILLVQRFGGHSPLRWLFYVIAVVYAAVDVAENLALEAAFASVDITASEVAFASFLTTAKFVLFAAAILAFAFSFMLNRPAERASAR